MVSSGAVFERQEKSVAVPQPISLVLVFFAAENETGREHSQARGRGRGEFVENGDPGSIVFRT